MAEPYTVKTPILAKASKVLDIVMSKGIAEIENDLSVANALKAASTAPRVVSTDLRVRLSAPAINVAEGQDKTA